jgi:hypothetical protein
MITAYFTALPNEAGGTSREESSDDDDHRSAGDHDRYGAQDVIEEGVSSVIMHVLKPSVCGVNPYLRHFALSSSAQLASGRAITSHNAMLSKMFGAFIGF